MEENTDVPKKGAVKQYDRRSGFDLCQECEEVVSDKKESVPTCQTPPKGWSCSRGEGHEGPCAAKEIDPHDSDCSCYGDSTADGEPVIHSVDCKNCTCEAKEESQAPPAQVNAAPAEQYYATGYTRVDLEAMHPNIKLEPEWRRCSQCLRENCVETWAKFNGKCPSCGDLFDKEESQAPAIHTHTVDCSDWCRKRIDDLGPSILSIAADGLAEALRKCRDVYFTRGYMELEAKEIDNALAAYEKAKAKEF